MPSVPGIRRSNSTTSGRYASAIETAASPSPASPTSSNSGSASNMPRSPSRTTGWSSTISRRIGPDPSPIRGSTWRRDRDRDGRAGARFGLDLHRARKLLDALTHPDQAEAAPVAVGGGREPGPVVADVQGDRVVHERQRDARVGRAGMLGDVAQPLLGGTQQ